MTSIYHNEATCTSKIYALFVQVIELTRMSPGTEGKVQKNCQQATQQHHVVHLHVYSTRKQLELQAHTWCKQTHPIERCFTQLW